MGHVADTVKEILAYQGFDAIFIANFLFKRIEEEATANVKDIPLMIQICCERGSNLTKISNASTAELVTLIGRLKGTYALKDKAKNSKTNITLPRICMTFPQVTCSYMQWCTNSTVKYHDITQYCDEYPKQMMTGAFASMIPQSHNSSLELTSAFLV